MLSSPPPKWLGPEVSGFGTGGDREYLHTHKTPESWAPSVKRVYFCFIHSACIHIAWRLFYNDFGACGFWLWPIDSASTIFHLWHHIGTQKCQILEHLRFQMFRLDIQRVLGCADPSKLRWSSIHKWKKKPQYFQEFTVSSCKVKHHLILKSCIFSFLQILSLYILSTFLLGCWPSLNVGALTLEKLYHEPPTQHFPICL